MWRMALTPEVVQLTAPDTQPNSTVQSRAETEINCLAQNCEPAIALSKGLDRDRAVDETGGQIAVFGRIGSRPCTLPECKSCMRPDRTSGVFAMEVRQRILCRLRGAGR